MQYKLITLIIIAAIILIIPDITIAQSIWLHDNHDHTLTLEVIKPHFKRVKTMSRVRDTFNLSYHYGYPLRFYNGAWYPIDYSSFNSLLLFLSFRRPMGNKILITAELPYARTEFDMKIADGYSFFRYNGYENSIGNPYLGLELGRKTSWLTGGIGVRLPMVSDKKVNITDACAHAVSDRLEAFHKYASIKVGGSIRLKHKSGLELQLRTGLLYFLMRENPDLQLWHVPSSLSLGYENPQMSIKYILHFRLEFSYQDYGEIDFSGITGLTTDINLGDLRPGAHLSLSYHEGYRILNFGFHLGYQFRQSN